MSFDTLTGLGYGIITFAIVIGIGLVVLNGFGKAVADCPTGYAWNTNGSTTYETNTCCIDAGHTCTLENATTNSKGSDAAVYMMGQLGEDGLASWTPAIIALVVGMLFLGMFLAKGTNRV